MANVKQFKQKTTGALLDIEDAQARKDIAAEVTNRTNADKVLDDKIKAETEARISANNVLQGKIAELNDKKITKFYASNIGETVLKDSDNGKIVDMMLYGKSKQKQYSGKNLLNCTLKTTTLNGVKCTNNGDGTYTLNGTASNNTYFILQTMEVKEGTYILVGMNNSKGYLVSNASVITEGQIKNIEAPVTLDFMICCFKNNTFNNDVVKPMLTTDLTATYDDFEPYVGGIPSPNPDYPQEIKSVVNPKLTVCGKNLINVVSKEVTNNGITVKVLDNIITLNGTNTGKVSVGINFVDPILLNGTYTISGGIPQIHLYLSDTIDDSVTQYFESNNKTFTVTNKYARRLFVYIGANETLTFNNQQFKIQLEKGSTATEYKPYKRQTATLPYTLNAIPVSSGGNITIDGQQYIADYVDIEKKKLVRMTNKVILSKDSMPDLSPSVSTKNTSVNIFQSFYSSLGMRDYKYNGVYHITPDIVTNGMIVSKLKARTDFSNISWKHLGDGEFGTNSLYGNDVPNNWMMFATSKASTSEEFKELFDGTEIIYQINKKEINLTDSEVEAFKDLMTYYPTTNVIVTSDQLDGFTTFNYPLSMANGWNIIKEQLGDTREYIYDMELQSAEAYVNSEYAVTLTELGV